MALCLLLLTALCATAQSYYDITQYYLRNALFDDHFDYTASQTGNVAEEQLPVDGWTAAHTANYTIVGIYQVGTKKTYNGASIPAQNVDGTAAGGVLALSFNTLTLKRSVLADALRESGFSVTDRAPFCSLEHEVEQAVVRDVIFALKSKEVSSL